MDFNSKIIKNIGLEGKPSDHKIAVAMSGGVDSSVTAALLHKSGYNVFGISMPAQHVLEFFTLIFSLYKCIDTPKTL